MRVRMELSGPKGRMWGFDMDYEKLPPEYAMEIAAAAKGLASYIESTAGNATGQDPAYTIAFTYKAEDATVPKDPAYAPLFAGKAATNKLLYSQAVAFQKAGAQLLLRLIESAELEVISGQRK